MKRWTFWIIKWDNGPVYEEVKSVRRKWPVTMFENMAKRKGFTKFNKDTMLIGGYFSQPDSGDCLVCIPSDMKPQDIF